MKKNDLKEEIVRDSKPSPLSWLQTSLDWLLTYFKRKEVKVILESRRELQKLATFEDLDLGPRRCKPPSFERLCSTTG